MSCCGKKKKSRCSEARTKHIRKVQNKIKSLIGVKKTGTRALEQALEAIDFKEQCPPKAIVSATRNYIDNEYTKHYRPA